MSVELWLLAGSILLALVQIGLASQAAKGQTGIAWSVGPRDQPRPLTGIAARLERAQRNLMETLPLFIAAVLLVHVAGHETWLSTLGAAMFLGGRIAYLPVYALGVPWLRSILWNVASLGIVLILASLFL